MPNSKLIQPRTSSLLQNSRVSIITRINNNVPFSTHVWWWLRPLIIAYLSRLFIPPFYPVLHSVVVHALCPWVAATQAQRCGLLIGPPKPRHVWPNTSCLRHRRHPCPCDATDTGTACAALGAERLATERIAGLAGMEFGGFGQGLEQLLQATQGEAAILRPRTRGRGHRGEDLSPRKWNCRGEGLSTIKVESDGERIASV